MSQDIIDKQALWGDFRDAERQNREWREKLANKAAHKALDIPLDGPGLGVHVTKNESTGLGWKELVAFGGIGLAGLLGYGALQKPAAQQVPPAIVQPLPPPPHTPDFKDTDTNTKYDLRWGN